MSSTFGKGATFTFVLKLENGNVDHNDIEIENKKELKSDSK